MSVREKGDLWTAPWTIIRVILESAFTISEVLDPDADLIAA